MREKNKNEWRWKWVGKEINYIMYSLLTCKMFYRLELIGRAIKHDNNDVNKS
jgi:hypothetical protein